jgi:hypothetical protein
MNIWQAVINRVIAFTPEQDAALRRVSTAEKYQFPNWRRVGMCDDKIHLLTQQFVKDNPHPAKRKEPTYSKALGEYLSAASEESRGVKMTGALVMTSTCIGERVSTCTGALSLNRGHDAIPKKTPDMQTGCRRRGLACLLLRGLRARAENRPHTPPLAGHSRENQKPQTPRHKAAL